MRAEVRLLRKVGWVDVPRSVIADLRAIRFTGLAVYCVLAAHKNREGLCWPSQRRLVAVCGMNRRTLQRAINRLAERMHIDVLSIGDGRDATQYLVRGGLTDHPGAVVEPREGRSQRTPNDTQRERESVNERSASPKRARRFGEPITGYDEKPGRAYPGTAATRAYLRATLPQRVK